MLHLICCLVSFGACLLGTICGMGGGIIIKPVLDATAAMGVATVSFMSGCAVIAMSCWSVGKAAIRGDAALDLRSTPLLAIGAALGGVAGKQLFNLVAAQFANPDAAGGVQAALLLLATLLTLLYTLRRERFHPRQLKSRLAALGVGLLLGLLGAFLGIGGGPFNVAVLCHFFSMPTKRATQNSLLIVLFSQLAGTLQTLLCRGAPEVEPLLLAAMIAVAVAASEAGQRIHRRISERQATRCLEGAMLFIMGISAYNMCKFWG